MYSSHRMKTTPPPGYKFVRDWHGLRVRVIEPLSNGWMYVPVGSTAIVKSCLGGTGLTLTCDPCPHCGISMLISRVPSRAVEVV